MIVTRSEYEEREATRIERYHLQVLAALDHEAARPDRAIPPRQQKRWRMMFKGFKRGKMKRPPVHG